MEWHMYMQEEKNVQNERVWTHERVFENEESTKKKFKVVHCSPREMECKQVKCIDNIQYRFCFCLTYHYLKCQNQKTISQVF